MTKQGSTTPSAKCGVTIICFLMIVAMQGYLLRNIPTNNSFSILSLPFILEFIFCILMIIGSIVCFVNPKGWTNTLGCVTALTIFGIYTIISIINYETFLAAYLTGFSPQYNSSAGAMVGFKLVLALIGVTAGIPVIAPIDSREYSKRLREKVQEQDAKWAKASAIAAKNELESTLSKLKEKYSEEELSEILSQLYKSNNDSASDKEDIIEQWRGWGGGM